MDYYFLSPEEFKAKIDADEFLEWEEVYEGRYYGTLRSEVDRIWSEGKQVIFDIDVEGACFAVNLIPETLRVTNFSLLAVGDRVNIEIDQQTQAIVDTVERTLERQRAG